LIEISDAAKRMIEEMLAKNPGKHLRIVIEGNGCAGPYLGIILDEGEPNEIITRVNGIDISISDDVKKYADTSSINLYVNQMGEDYKKPVSSI
jgi:Fe-S cluster assembly iron-binding protein IscA